MSWRRRHAGTACATVRLPEIVGKQRPRHTRAGRVYTPGKTRKAEAWVRADWLEQVGSAWADWSGEVRVRVWFTRELAKSNPKYWAGRADLGKPDLDNAVKAALDALNGAAWADDAQITKIEAAKGLRTPHGAGCLVRIQADYYEETYTKE